MNISFWVAPKNIVRGAGVNTSNFYIQIFGKVGNFYIYIVPPITFLRVMQIEMARPPVGLFLVPKNCMPKPNHATHEIENICFSNIMSWIDKVNVTVFSSHIFGLNLHCPCQEGRRSIWSKYANCNIRRKSLKLMWKIWSSLM